MAKYLTLLILLILLSSSVIAYRSAITSSSSMPFSSGSISINESFLNSTYVRYSNVSSLNVNSSVWWNNLNSISLPWLYNSGSSLTFNQTHLSSYVSSLIPVQLTPQQPYLYETSNNLYFNETKLNQTIESKLPSPTEYTGTFSVSSGEGNINLYDLKLSTTFFRVTAPSSNYTVIVTDLDTGSSYVYAKARNHSGVAQSLPFGNMFNNININVTSSTIDDVFNYTLRGVKYE